MDDSRISRIADGVSRTAARFFFPRCEATIAEEVVSSGASRGWNAKKTGDRTWQAAHNAEKALSKFNIGYVDDMDGEWGFSKGGTDFFTDF